MNVGKMRKKRECLLLLWLGHHYLLMSNNINTTTAAVSAKIARPFLPTVNGTSCHWIYSIRTSPTNTTKVNEVEGNLMHYYFEKSEENQSNRTCFKNLIKCSFHPRIVHPESGRSGPQKTCITYKEPFCFSSTDDGVHVEKQGHVCSESKWKGNQICGSSRCSLCLYLKRSLTVTAVAATTKIENGITTEIEDTEEKSKNDSAEESVCVCLFGYKGPKCDEIEREQFVPGPTDFDSQFQEILNGYKKEDKWIVGITLVGLISVAFCGVFFVLVCCIYIFIKHVVASFSAIANEHRIQMAMFPLNDNMDEEFTNLRCKLSDLQFCCQNPQNELDQVEIEMEDFDDDTFPP